jgi:hypothetical protein
MAKKSNTTITSAATVGFDAKLWAAACILWPDMDASEYKHVVLGLIFLKYISDAFEAKHAALAKNLEVLGYVGSNMKTEAAVQYRITWGLKNSGLNACPVVKEYLATLAVRSRCLARHHHLQASVAKT